MELSFVLEFEWEGRDLLSRSVYWIVLMVENKERWSC